MYGIAQVPYFHRLHIHFRIFSLCSQAREREGHLIAKADLCCRTFGIDCQVVEMLAVGRVAVSILPDCRANFFAVALWVGKLRSLAATDTRSSILQ